jgi:hypothetical protein
MNKRRTLSEMLKFLEQLRQDPSNLSPRKYIDEVAKAAQVEARGWKYLAGESEEDIDELIALVGDEPMTTFLLNRNVPDGNGRRTGSKDSRYAERDAVIITAIRNGALKRRAVIARRHIKKQYGAYEHRHAKRIQRKMEEQDAEARCLVALQTPDPKPADIK